MCAAIEQYFKSFACQAVWLTPALLCLNACLPAVAAVPGMVAGMVRHLQSLRFMKRDHGWIYTCLVRHHIYALPACGCECPYD